MNGVELFEKNPITGGSATEIKKRIIGDADYAISYVIEIPRGNGTTYDLCAIKNKKLENITYSLFRTKDEAEFAFFHREIVKWIEREYQIKLDPRYYVEDIWDCWGDGPGWHTVVYSAPLGGGTLEVRVDFEGFVISANCNGGETAFWDAVAARLVQHMLETLSQRAASE